MLTLPLKQNTIPTFMPSLEFSSKEKKVLKGMLYLFLVDFIVFVFILRMIVMPTQAVSAEEILPAPTIMNELTEAGMEPKMAALVKRPSFSGSGSVLSVGADTMEVFEYEDSDLIQKEAVSFVRRNSAIKTNPWRDLMHVYIKDKSVIYYMGNNQSVLDKLNEMAGTPIQ